MVQTLTSLKAWFDCSNEPYFAYVSTSTWQVACCIQYIYWYPGSRISGEGNLQATFKEQCSIDSGLLEIQCDIAVCIHATNALFFLHCFLYLADYIVEFWSKVDLIWAPNPSHAVLWQMQPLTNARKLMLVQLALSSPGNLWIFIVIIMKLRQLCLLLSLLQLL